MKNWKKQKRKSTKKQKSNLTLWRLTSSIIAMPLVVITLLLVAYKLTKEPEVTIEEVQAAEHEFIEVSEPEPVILPELNYTYDELELLAHLIEAESGGDSELEMWYTGSVVLNRMNSNKYPSTLEGVIYQSGQYECTWNGHIDKESSDIAYEVAAELLANGGIIPDYIIYQAEFTQGQGVYEKINHTYYCY